VVADRWIYGYVVQPAALRFYGPSWLALAALRVLPRPNLVVSSLALRPTARAGRYRYVAFVRNTGRSAADASQLRVAYGGLALPLAAVDALQPGEGIEVAVTGPACAEGAPVDADADAGEAVDERDEADNRFTRLCPPAPPS